MTGAPLDSTAAASAALREHPIAQLVRLRAMRRALWMRQLWAREPEAAHPAAIQHEEVDRILADPATSAEREATFYREDGAAAALSHAIDDTSQALAQDENWQRLADVFRLTIPEQQLLSLAVAFAFEPTVGRAFAYLHDQPEMTYATPWLAAALYGPGVEPYAVARDSALVKWRLVSRAPETIPVQGIWTGWIADPAIVAWIDRGGTHDLPAGAVLTHPDSFRALPVAYPDQLAIATAFLATSKGLPSEIELVAPDGSGRSVLAGQIAADSDKPLLAVGERDLVDANGEGEIRQTVFRVARSAWLHDALLYWRDARESTAAACRALRAAGVSHIAGRTAALVETPPAGMLFRSIELPPLDRAAREQLWSVISRGPVPSQVRDWLLTPGEIVQLARVEHAGAEAIQQACRRPSDSLTLLVKLPLPFKETDLILPATIQKALDDFENQVRFRWDVYEEWGFSRLCQNGRGVIGLFAGPSGTGKTMAAQVLARKLGLELYRLDPAQVINKYIGETEKRLKVIFDECDRAHFMLLVDECEGMFGQRFSSKDAHDRYANLEIDYLLQRIERFQGISVLSTNRKGDLDAAFMRRIRYVIDFLPPGPAERRRLWENALPTKSPSGEVIVEDVDWTDLAERVPLTGAEITLAALNAAFLARASNSTIRMPHVLEAVRRELAKKGQTLRGFE